MVKIQQGTKNNALTFKSDNRSINFNVKAYHTKLELLNVYFDMLCVNNVTSS